MAEQGTQGRRLQGICRLLRVHGPWLGPRPPRRSRRGLDPDRTGLPRPRPRHDPRLGRLLEPGLDTFLARHGTSRIDRRIRRSTSSGRRSYAPVAFRAATPPAVCPMTQELAGKLPLHVGASEHAASALTGGEQSRDHDAGPVRPGSPRRYACRTRSPAPCAAGPRRCSTAPSRWAAELGGLTMVTGDGLRRSKLRFDVERLSAPRACIDVDDRACRPETPSLPRGSPA